MGDRVAIAGDDRLLRDREAAGIFGVSRSKFWAGVKAGVFPAPVRIGGSTRWSRNACQARLRQLLGGQGESGAA